MSPSPSSTLVEETGRARDRVAQPGRRRVAAERAQVDQIREADRVIHRAALDVRAVGEDLFAHLALEERERVWHAAEQLVREGEGGGVAEQMVREQVEGEVVAQEERVPRDLAAEPRGVRVAVAQLEERSGRRPVHQPRRDGALVPRHALEARLRDRLRGGPAARQREEAVAEGADRRVSRCASARSIAYENSCRCVFQSSASIRSGRSHATGEAEVARLARGT